MKRFGLVLALVSIFAFASICSAADELWQAGGFGVKTSATTNVVKTDEDGNVYTASQITLHFHDGRIVIVLTKYKADGTKLWGRVCAVDSGTSEETGLVMTLDKEGNVYLAVAKNVRGKNSIAIVKYDTHGNRLWENDYIPSYNAHPSLVSIVSDRSGNTYIAANLDREGTLLKFIPDGTLEWLVVVPDRGRSEVFALDLDPSQKPIVAALSDGRCHIMRPMVVKYDQDGNVSWNRVFVTSGGRFEREVPAGIAVDRQGNIIMAVTAYFRNNSTDSDIATIKYSPEGERLWMKRYFEKGPRSGNRFWNETAGGVGVDRHGNVYVGGTVIRDHKQLGYLDLDLIALKYDSEGNRLWKTYIDSGERFERDEHRDDTFKKMEVIRRSGSIVLLGIENYVLQGRQQNEYRYNGEYFFTTKLTTSGHVVWSRTHERRGSWRNEPRSLDVDPSGNSIVAGSIRNVGSGMQNKTTDSIVIKYPAGRIRK